MAEPVLGATISAEEVRECFRRQTSRCASILEHLLTRPGPRTRADTLDPLNELYATLNDSSSLAGLLRSVHPEPSVREAAEEGERTLASFANELALNRELFEVLRGLDRSPLDPTGVRLVERLLRDFHRAGVDREAPVRERVRALREELVLLGQDFLRNIQSDVRSIEIEGPADLEGLPEDYVRAHPAEKDGRIQISTEYPDYTPFMTYCARAEPRRRLYVEFRRRAYPTNLEVLDRLLHARHELATLLGYPSWAAYVTEDEMIGSPTAVGEFIERVSATAESRALAEFEALLREKRRHDPRATTVHDWEKAYYEELVRRREFRVDSKEVRRYFDYERTKAGILRLTEELFDIRFEPVPSAPRWHPDVEVLDVRENGVKIGRIYLDMHPRQGKFKHAGMFPLTRGVRGRKLPEGALVCNFPHPRTNGVAYLGHDDVVTFFHEVGHLLHHLFAGGGEWAKFSGTATEWDFVEVPSQLYEEWAWDPEVLRTFAKHPESGEPIPRRLVEEMRRARSLGRALWIRHQMFYAAVSLRAHGADPSSIDTSRLVAEMQNRYSLFDFVGDTYFQASFGHLDEYSALYYTYMWSLVIEKDIFGEFRKGNSILDREVARRYRERVLAPGGTRDAMDLVRDFLGRGYSFEAFERWMAGEE